jgi:hypothetical protein
MIAVDMYGIDGRSSMIICMYVADELCVYKENVYLLKMPIVLCVSSVQPIKSIRNCPAVCIVQLCNDHACSF